VRYQVKENDGGFEPLLTSFFFQSELQYCYF
jgi:hypothetical protein